MQRRFGRVIETRAEGEGTVAVADGDDGGHASELSPEETLGQLRLEEGMPEWCEEAFTIFIHVVPLALLYVLFDIMIHAQYGIHPTLGEEVERLTSNIPALSVLVTAALYALKRYPTAMQALLTLASLVFGIALITTVNTAPYLAVMRQCPGLGVLWIFVIICLDLRWALVSLAGVGVYTYSTGYKILF